MYLCPRNYDLSRGGTFETAKAGTFHSVTAGTLIPLSAVYFFFGIFFFRFELYKYIDSAVILFILLLLYAVCYYYSITLLTSMIGIMMICSLCLMIGRYFPKLFSSFREYIFQIYLMSLPFQTFVELILWKHYFYHEQLFYLFFALNLLSGLFIPVFISKLVERCPIKAIRLCFGLQ